MNCRKLFLLLLILSLSTITFMKVTAQNGNSMLPPPVTEKKPKITEINGDRLVDNYFSLREKSNPAVISHLEAENAYTEATMKPTQPLQAKLYNEILSHIKQTDENVPYRWGDYFYYTRTKEGLQYPIFCRKHQTLAAPEQIILDVNELAKGQKFMSVGSFAPSDEGDLLAYSTDNTGYRQYTLQIKNLRTGELFPEKIERVDDLAWATDNKTIFYVTEDAVTKRNDKMFRHVLGTDKYELIYEEKDELFDIGVGRSRDKAIIQLEAASKTSTESRYIPANNPDAEWKVIVPRQPDHEYDVAHRGNFFYIRTNKGAKNFRVVAAPVSDPSEKNWKEFVAHRPAVKIEGVDMFADHAVLAEWENGLQQIEIVDFKTNKRHRVEFPEPVYSTGVGPNRELGEPWRDAGRMMNKINTFTDFIACAEHLTKQRYTSSDRLVIQGGSAGGMLMGAVTNMRPDLFKAVVAQVPFVDVLNTMLDAS